MTEETGTLTCRGIAERENGEGVRNGGNQSQKCAEKPATREEGLRGALSIVVAPEAWRGAGDFVRMINWEGR